MSRRLFQRGGTAVDTPNSGRSRHAPNIDVPYEPPSFPLSQGACNSLGEVSRSRDTLAYQNQLKESLRHLGHSVYDLHDRLQAQRSRLESLRSRREEKGTEKTPDEERVEAHVAQLEREVEGLARKSETAVRDVIDQKARLEDDATVLGELYTQLSTSRRNVDADAENQEPPEQGTIDTWREQREQKQAAYQQIPPYQRYAVDNDYAAFKKLWHDSLVGDDGPPLADPSRWFRQDGTPALGTTAATGTTGGGFDNEGEEDGSDEDIAVAREVLSLKCPLTLRPFVEPYSNHKCKHTFEKSAILDYLVPGHGAMQCPQTGCSERFTRAAFNKDFYLDQVMLRRIQRAKQAEENRDLEMDSDDSENEESVVVRGRRQMPGRLKEEGD